MDQAHLLVIEDDEAVGELLVSCLRGADFRVSAARSGEEGLRLVEEDPPHLVLLDISLPGMNGLDVCRELRRDPWMAKIPVLMLTGRVEDDDVVAGLEVGADDYMTKPFKAKVLTARVNALLRRGRGDSGVQAAAGIPAEEPPLLEIRTLGRCEMQLGPRVVDWIEAFSPAQRMLLSLLLAASDGRIPQEEVQVTFWPDTRASRARSNFDSLMMRLRKTIDQELAPADVRRHLLLRGGILCLEEARVDALEFRRLALKGGQQVRARELWQAELAFSSAFSLWQGTFLPGDFGCEAAAAFKDELEQLYLEASQLFARVLAESGRHQEAVKLLRYAQRYNQTHDGLVRLLYQLLLAQEHKAQARQLLDQYAVLLSREKFSPAEIGAILADFPKTRPKGSWLVEK